MSPVEKVNNQHDIEEFEKKVMNNERASNMVSNETSCNSQNNTHGHKKTMYPTMLRNSKIDEKDVQFSFHF